MQIDATRAASSRGRFWSSTYRQSTSRRDRSELVTTVYYSLDGRAEPLPRRIGWRGERDKDYYFKTDAGNLLPEEDGEQGATETPHDDSKISDFPRAVLRGEPRVIGARAIQTSAFLTWRAWDSVCRRRDYGGMTNGNGSQPSSPCGGPWHSWPWIRSSQLPSQWGANGAVS